MPKGSVNTKDWRRGYNEGTFRERERAQKSDIFIVVLHIQNIFGPYSTKESAIENANRLASEDVDDYHYWEVYKLDRRGLELPLYQTSKGQIK
jgi:hypothetical protein